MVDREKVIKGLEVCLPDGLPNRCIDCPYHNNGCALQRDKDALELLKEQKHGYWILYERSKGFPDWKCSVCGGSGRGDYKFCPWCSAEMDEEVKQDD